MKNIMKIILILIIIFIAFIIFSSLSIPPPSACGDGKCIEETCDSCPKDCGICPPEKYCGNKVCELGETCFNCQIDCGLCPPTCYDECSLNQKRCNGNYIQICGQYDSDNCLEWGGDNYCQWGCINGECVIHSVEILDLNSNLKNPIIYASYEKSKSWYIQNKIYVDVKNSGNIDENLVLKCEGIVQNIFVQKYSTKRFTFDWDVKEGYDTITCSVENQYVFKDKFIYFTSSESAWYSYDKTKTRQYLYCDAQPDCNNFAIKSLAESLRKDTPSATVVNDLTFIQNNMIYNQYYLSVTWFAKASEVYQGGSGVCSQLSIFFAGITRAQGIPTKTISSCVSSSFCEWWDIGCQAYRLIIGNPNHAWNYVWINNEWKFADPTIAVAKAVNYAYPTKPSNFIYYNERECNDYANYDGYDDCYTYNWWTESCRI